MNKNTAKISAGIRALHQQQQEIISGKVVSIDTGSATMTIRPTGDGEPIENVRLSPIGGSSEGCILFPEANSDVVIASIDGPGEWILLKADKITKATVKIGSVNCEVTDSVITLKNGSVLLEVGNAQFKLNTPSETLFDILNDLISYISALTVSTSTGPSGVPLNISDFITLSTRLSNLLTH